MKPPKLLIVEDDVEFQKVAIDTIQSLGYQHQCVNNSNEALRQIKVGQYHGVLLDLCIPVTPGNPTSIEYGLNCLSEIRKIKNSRQLPVIIMTTYSDKALHRISKLRDLGAYDTIAKSAFIDCDVSPSDTIRKMIESLPAFSKGRMPMQKFSGGIMKIYDDRIELNDIIIISDKNGRWSIPMLRFLAGQKKSSGEYAYRSGDAILKQLGADNIGQITGAANTIRSNIIKRMRKENWECQEHDVLEHRVNGGYRINPWIKVEIVE